MFHYVIFDLDGTLLNTLDDLADAGNEICRQNGWPVHPTEAYKRMVGNGIPRLVERFSPPECRAPEQLADTLARFRDYYSAHSADRTAPYPGIPALLERLNAAGVYTGVFTNKADEIAVPLLERYFGRVFTAARGSLPGVPVKPDPAGLFDLMALMRADPAQTLFVGDSDVDILTGHNAGLPAAGVLWGFRSAEELRGAGADFLAETPAQLLDLILR